MTTSTLRRMRGLGAGVSAAALLAGANMAAAPTAEAYGSNIMTFTTKVNTANCDSSGDRRASKKSGGCFVEDYSDNTFLTTDKGGRAVKFELWSKSGSSWKLRGKVEFHPYAEKLWVYDTSNDGDTIYVDVTTKKYGKQIVVPPGTGKKMDYTVHDMNLAEGSSVKVEVFDGYNEWGGTGQFVTMKGTA